VAIFNDLGAPEEAQARSSLKALDRGVDEEPNRD
jgi:hypothetical protein